MSLDDEDCPDTDEKEEELYLSLRVPGTCVADVLRNAQYECTPLENLVLLPARVQYDEGEGVGRSITVPFQVSAVS